MKKMILKADEKVCLNAIAEFEAKLQAGTGSFMTKLLLKEAQDQLAKIQKELSQLK